MIRIHVGYQPTASPWGGANNFMRALRNELLREGGFALTDSMGADCDILFMNQLTVGPGQRTSFRRVRRFRRGERTGFDWLRRRIPPRASSLVVRAVNLNSHAFTMGIRNAIIGRLRDAEVLKVLDLADLVVFQSQYQRSVFVDKGYAGSRNTVIHNGADPAFWVDDIARRPSDGILRIGSSTASPRASKRHDLIAALSEVPGVEVMHFGNWPAAVDVRRVRRYGMVSREKMTEVYATCDYFFHPALRDPCPNAVFEAVCSGLPVIYNPGPGSSAEIVGTNGLPMDETDLAATIERARSLLAPLKLTVLKNRADYTVHRAARQYREAFEMVAADLGLAKHQ
ncbi:MAG TPA: glycosyltransferase [Vicinamibacterales bacterium]|nr:glycosyltransferase [Vicinamibacterales bacterium]